MKNKIIPIIILIAVMCLSWSTVLTPESSNEEVVETIVQRITYNNEVKTYKNNLSLYTQLISLEPDNIEWYVGLADTYWNMEQYSNYKDQCEVIVKNFPEDRTGHLRLIQYYADSFQASEVIQIYNAAPTSIKEDPEILAIYQASEWNYNFLSRAYSSVGVCSGNAYVVEYNGIYGYISKSMSGEIPAQFTTARPFIDAYAAVNKDDEWYFIDGVGDRVLATKEKIEDLYSFSEGYAVAKIDGVYGYIDYSFNKFVFEYEDATNFYNGIAAVKKDGKWGLINQNFEMLTSFEYDDVVRDDANICCRKGIVFFLQGNEYYMLGMDGQKVTNESFEDAKLFYSDYAAVKKDKKWGFIDKSGNVVMDFTFDEASSFVSGIAAVRKGENWGCVNANGAVILDFDYEYAMITADNGIVVLKVGEAYRFIKFIKFN